MCTAAVIGCDPPPPHIWARIRGLYWSAKIDNISFWPSETMGKACRRKKNPSLSVYLCVSADAKLGEEKGAVVGTEVSLCVYANRAMSNSESKYSQPIHILPYPVFHFVSSFQLLIRTFSCVLYDDITAIHLIRLTPLWAYPRYNFSSRQIGNTVE